MIDNKYFTKEDMVVINGTATTTYSVEVTSEIMQGVTDRKSLILAIENYNDTHKLPYNKRVRYAIGIGGNVYVSV